MYKCQTSIVRCSSSVLASNGWPQAFGRGTVWLLTHTPHAYIYIKSEINIRLLCVFLQRLRRGYHPAALLICGWASPTYYGQLSWSDTPQGGSVTEASVHQHSPAHLGPVDQSASARLSPAVQYSQWSACPGGALTRQSGPSHAVQERTAHTHVSTCKYPQLTRQSPCRVSSPLSLLHTSATPHCLGSFSPLRQSLEFLT